VPIQSIDVRGEAELGASPRELGLRVMERSPTLTVAMVNDYLEASLFDLNQQHLWGQALWLLFQLSGDYPLVRPVFDLAKALVGAALPTKVQTFTPRQDRRSLPARLAEYRKDNGYDCARLILKYACRISKSRQCPLQFAQCHCKVSRLPSAGSFTSFRLKPCMIVAHGQVLLAIERCDCPRRQEKVLCRVDFSQCSLHSLS
jgi:hypothetical protein